MFSPGISFYGLYLNSVTREQYEAAGPGVAPATTLIFKSLATVTNDANINQFMSDIEIMNKVRESTDPAVKEAYEQMLTVMALTKGRDLNDS